MELLEPLKALIRTLGVSREKGPIPSSRVRRRSADRSMGNCAQLWIRVRMRVTFVGYEKTVPALPHGLARTVVKQHRHRFRGRGGLVEQRSIRDLHAGQVDHHGLEIQQGFQTTLRDLGLIGRVGGVPARIFEDIALDYRAERWCRNSPARYRY